MISFTKCYSSKFYRSFPLPAKSTTIQQK